ncbi:MAG: SRPBCC domain-containing protein [Rhizobiaceae bacterium]|nr:SRPBCC domain-containing protein [Rhizobiaceae bacterium]
MTPTDLSLTISTARPPHACFAAINDPRAWWGRDIAGRTDRLGEAWTYRYKDLHFSRQKVVELVPFRRIAWLVTDATMSFLTDTAEWAGTTIVFDLEPAGTGTDIRFAHLGLRPGIECFDICSNAWTGLIGGSLKGLIEDGRGDPDSVGKPAA